MYQNYGNIPSNPGLVQAFVGTVTNTGINNDWQIWTKPDNISLVMIIAIGGGGGGAGGFSSTNTGFTAGGGGGGGGAGAIFKTLIPADFVPPTLYVKVGIGGKGGVYNNGGTGGGVSYVATSPALNNSLYLAYADAGTGGGNGSQLGGGAQGTQGLQLNYATYNAAWVGMYFVSSAPPATRGSLAANAVSVNLVSPSAQDISIQCTGGAGGGGVDNSIPPPVAYNGGNINLPASMLSSLNVKYANNIISGGAGGASGQDGENGLNYGLTNFNNLNLLYPLIFTGGAGGGAAVSGVGYPAGNGGHGGIGSGGGGGGASLPRAAGFNGPPGLGGNGGPGLVLIVCA